MQTLLDLQRAHTLPSTTFTAVLCCSPAWPTSSPGSDPRCTDNLSKSLLATVCYHIWMGECVLMGKTEQLHSVVCCFPLQLLSRTSLDWPPALKTCESCPFIFSGHFLFLTGKNYFKYDLSKMDLGECKIEVSDPAALQGYL